MQLQEEEILPGARQSTEFLRLSFILQDKQLNIKVFKCAVPSVSAVCGLFLIFVY
jgi:hypothetical protein